MKCYIILETKVIAFSVYISKVMSPQMSYHKGLDLVQRHLDNNHSPNNKFRYHYQYWRHIVCQNIYSKSIM